MCVYIYTVFSMTFLNVSHQNYKIEEHPFLKVSNFSLSSELVPPTKMYVYAINIMPKRKKMYSCWVLNPK